MLPFFYKWGSVDTEQWRVTSRWLPTSSATALEYERDFAKRSNEVMSKGPYIWEDGVFKELWGKQNIEL